MNKRLKSTAIMMALIITLSVFTSLAATTTVAAHTTTTTTITASNKYPAVGQTITFTVTLKAGATGLSKPVKIWHYTNGVRWEDGTHNTVNGVYKFTQAFGSMDQRVYYAKFAGDSSYASSQGTVTVNVGKTTTTITASTTKALVNSPVTFTVTVKTGTSLLVGSQVKIWHTTSGVRYEDGTHYITSGGYKFTQTFTHLGSRVYHADFVGNSRYAPSSGTVALNVGGISTAIKDLRAYPSSEVVVNQKVRVDGHLTSTVGNLDGQKINIYHIVNGERINDGTVTTYYDTAWNAGHGYFFKEFTFTYEGNREFYVEFAGSSGYLSSKAGPLTIYVWLHMP